MPHNSRKANHARSINGSGTLSRLHESFVSRVLDVPLYVPNGPDLYDGSRFIEVKFYLAMAGSLAKKHGARDDSKNGSSSSRNGALPVASWTVLKNQIEYADFFYGEGFWALGTYTLDVPVQKLRPSMSLERLESHVTNRTVYIVPWSWMYQFPLSVTASGEYRYPKETQLPLVAATYQVDRGEVHLTEGVPEHAFDAIYW